MYLFIFHLIPAKCSLSASGRLYLPSAGDAARDGRVYLGRCLLQGKQLLIETADVCVDTDAAEASCSHDQFFNTGNEIRKELDGVSV